jgi:hypothetical protein
LIYGDFNLFVSKRGYKFIVKDNMSLRVSNK